MPHLFRIATTNKRTGECEQQEGEFRDADWIQLSRYLDCAHRLASCRMAESQSDLAFHFHGELGKPTYWEVSLPPEDDIAAFLLRMRPFLLAAEPTSFLKIRETIDKCAELPNRSRAVEQPIQEDCSRAVLGKHSIHGTKVGLLVLVLVILESVEPL